MTCRRAERWISWALAALAFLVLFAGTQNLVGCALLGSPSRVRTGELYAPGVARYDAYFGEVHAQQAAAAKWTGDRTAARKPLIDALKLAPDASDAAIAQATRDRVSTGALRLEVSGTDARVVPVGEAKSQSVLDAVEQAAKADAERRKRLEAVPAKVDELTKVGHELEAHIREDFAEQGGQKPFEVNEEMHASFDVLADIAERAKREARAVETFVADLQHAVASGGEMRAAGHGGSEKTSRHEESRESRGGGAPPARAREVPPASPAPTHASAPPPPKPPPPPAPVHTSAPAEPPPPKAPAPPSAEVFQP